MEITMVSPSSIKIRGKQAIIAINPIEKTGTQNAVILYGNPPLSTVKIAPDAVIIDGPGEYEISGVKITGVKNGQDIVYSLTVDNIDVLFGKILALERVQNKLKEHKVILVHADDTTDPSFLTGLSPSVVLFYGDQAMSAVTTFGTENAVKTSKYTATLEKLPQEMEAFVLG